jgi:hypothetical protein
MDQMNLLDEVVALALKLAPKERLQLIERVASSVERELVEAPAQFPLQNGQVLQSTPMTAAAIAAMLEQMEPIELVDPEVTDPVEWVQTQRRKDSNRLSIRQRQRLPS